MVSGRRVLVVDGLEETEQVLRAVLEPRGHEVSRVQVGGVDESRCERRAPSVVVLHDDRSPESRLALEKWGRVPHVVIGSADLPSISDGSGQYLRNPFQYRELIQAVERLLGTAHS